MNIEKSTLWIMLGIATVIIIGFILTRKPQPDTKLQVEYATIKEHARITDSLLVVVANKATADSAELSIAMMNLERLYADTNKIRVIYEKSHAAVRAANLEGTVKFSADHLPKDNPYR